MNHMNLGDDEDEEMIMEMDAVEENVDNELCIVDKFLTSNRLFSKFFGAVSLVFGGRRRESLLRTLARDASFVNFFM